MSYSDGFVLAVPTAHKDKFIAHTTLGDAVFQDEGALRIVEAWGDDAKRMTANLHVGRQLAVTGVLRYNTWTTQDGQQRGMYQVRVKSGTYAFFGKNKKKEEVVVFVVAVERREREQAYRKAAERLK